MVWETRGEGRRDHRYWRGRTVVLFVATVACMAVLVVGVGGSAVGASSQSPTRSLRQGVGAGDFAPSPGMVAELRRQAEEDRARRESEPARQARVRSRRAHAHLSRDESVAVARAAHRNVLEAGPSSPFRLRGGERLLGYVGSDEARVQLADGSKARVESTLPLRARNAAGDLAPVDLSFADHGSFFSPGNPLTALRVAKRLGDGISLGDVGVRVLPAGGGDVQGSLVGHPVLGERGH